MSLRAFYESQHATVANDGIPLHFGDQAEEYRAALNDVVLMDRSHEGRFELHGRDRLAIPHRISTNDLTSLKAGEGRPTLFTNANARILDRATFYNLGSHALALTEPGRGEALLKYLQRNIFFNDEAQLKDLYAATRQFVLHGPQADAVSTRFAGESFTHGLSPLHATTAQVGGSEVLFLRDKPISGSHWRVIVANEAVEAVWMALLEAGREVGLQPAGSLTYNALRIRAGRPGVGRELSPEYIPLEVGLWDEVSFTKGCYTGQEIIARMESRGKLAKTIVHLKLAGAVEAPAKLLNADGRDVGVLTSSVQTPDGERLGIGVLRLAAAETGAHVVAGDGTDAVIVGMAGAQAPA